MSQSTYKGGIAGGSIAATFRSSAANAGTDLLTVSYAEVGGTNPKLAHGTAAPGGFAPANIETAKAGIIEVLVVTGSDTDSGTLTVTSNGAQVDTNDVTGSTRWVYSVGAK